jgi:hypothetical protein
LGECQRRNPAMIRIPVGESRSCEICPGRNTKGLSRRNGMGDFREASDWPSRGKAIRRDGFSVCRGFVPPLGGWRIQADRIFHRIPVMSMVRQHFGHHRHRSTCQNSAPGHMIVFTCRAADAMPDAGEARRLSRESLTLLRARLAVSRDVAQAGPERRLKSGSGGNSKPFR